MDARAEYTQRLQERERVLAGSERLHLRVGYVRLLIAVAAALMLWAVLARRLPVWALAIPVIVFVAATAYHAMVERRRTAAERAVSHYRRAIARVDGNWVGAGETGDRFFDPHHVYAGDLDLFGRGSLFELISTARTRIGEATLATWLLAPADFAEVRSRQEAVRELRSKVDLREAMAVLGEDARTGVHPEPLVGWAEAPQALSRPWLRWAALVLAILAAAFAIVWAWWGIASPFLVVFAIEAALMARLRRRADEVLHRAEHAFEDLDLLAGVLLRIETEKFESAKLRALAEEIESHHVRASDAMARLRSISDRIESRDNLILRTLDLPLLYSVQMAYIAERWRGEHGAAVRRWLDAVGEVEALISLSTYSFEHVEDPFPEIVEGEPLWEGEEICHPLIPNETCVRNDVVLGARTRLLLVSGSNMSGKSTLLRSVAINTVLAMAGATVRARRLRLSPMQVGASIRVNDSLQEGSSRFYAEIKRLRQVFDLAAEGRLLFVLDELLHGTNSADRRVGAQGILRALVRRGAVGLVSTHDLALTGIADEMGGVVRNVHFEDQIADGRIRFDYRLREGVVTKSNALELMRSVGLEV